MIPSLTLPRAASTLKIISLSEVSIAKLRAMPGLKCICFIHVYKLLIIRCKFRIHASERSLAFILPRGRKSLKMMGSNLTLQSSGTTEMDLKNFFFFQEAKNLCDIKRKKR